MNSINTADDTGLVMEHGTLLGIMGIGVLLRGKSGIGKSECALDLLNRGHAALVADDAVELTLDGGKVVGRSPDAIRNFLEIRGLGVVNVRELFGVPAVREKQCIDMVIELVEWQPDMVIDRTGMDDKHIELLSVTLPYLVIPVRTGRNLGTIVEIAARMELLRQSGVQSALMLDQQVNLVNCQGYGES